MKYRIIRTGICFPHFEGNRLSDFPQALAGILDKKNVYFYHGVYCEGNNAFFLKPVPYEILLKVHSHDMIEAVKRTSFYETALYSAGATVQAALEIYENKIDNAFAFTGTGDHHAGKDFFGGMCYFNGAALAISALKEMGMKKSAVIDTDSHHGDGTRDIFNDDEDVMHICFCDQDYRDNRSNVDVHIPNSTDDEYYLDKIRQIVIPSLTAFKPELIFWELGYDATQGEYGDKGLTRDFHVEATKLLKSVADETCQGTFIAILCGGSGRALATYIIPKVIVHLAELDKINGKS
jgi:acetoin utilization deacetylase AcuC-like enzyme